MFKCGDEEKGFRNGTRCWDIGIEVERMRMDDIDKA